MSFIQWLNDLRWAMNMRRARAFQRGLLFSERQVFMKALRHPASERGMVLDYPDTFFFTDIDDLLRAKRAVYLYRAARQGGFSDLLGKLYD